MELSMSVFAIQALHGLVYGMLLFFVASGFSLVFGMMGVINIAHAALYMVGAYLGYSVFDKTGSFWLALIVAPIGVGLLGAVIERYFLRKVHAYGHAFELLVTVGIFNILGELVKWIWGNFTLPTKIPSALSGSSHFAGLIYPDYRLFILLISLITLFLLLYIFLRTPVGIAIRAGVSDPEMVSCLGINTPRLFLYVFSGGAALAGLAGIVAGPFLSTHPAMGIDMLVDLFVVVVVGGLGSLGGTFLSALIIGELQSFGVLFIPQLALVLQFLLMAIVLIIRPAGLLGEKV